MMKVEKGCVVMEQAVLWTASPFDLPPLGEQVLVGPHAYLTGCSVGPQSFLATGSMVFNGSTLGRACVVALDGKVHIDTELAEDARIPIVSRLSVDLHAPVRRTKRHSSTKSSTS